MPMKIVSKNQWHTHFDRTLTPVLTVAPGEEVAIETRDACHGEVHSVEEFLKYRQKPSRGGDPLSGPIRIKGADPGNTLTVDVLKIELTGLGFQLIGPQRAIIRDEIPDWTCYTVAGHHDRFELSNGMTFPADPIVGKFGVAPANAPTSLPNPLGGNCDIPAVKAGCRLHLPIEVPGALFSLGDVHARQGDGEVVGAPEIEARVIVRFGLAPGRKSDWFMIEDTHEWHSAYSAANEGEAARLAVLQNARFISETEGVELKDALIFLTMAGRLTISRTATWGSLMPVVCSSFSKLTAQAAFADYKGRTLPQNA
jgi:amidase